MRNDRGELLAYVFITEADNLNLDLIHDGQAYADRRIVHSLHAPFEAAEKECRKNADFGKPSLMRISPPGEERGRKAADIEWVHIVSVVTSY